MKVLLSVLFCANYVAAAYENVILLQREKTTGKTSVRWLGDFANNTVTTNDGVPMVVLKTEDDYDNTAEIGLLISILVIGLIIIYSQHSEKRNR